MDRSCKPGILLAALALVGALLTSAQATGGAAPHLAAAPAAEAPDLDSGAEIRSERERLYGRWREDAERARRQGRRVALAAATPKRRPPLEAPVTGGDPYVYFPTGSAVDARFLVLAGPQGTSTLTDRIIVKLAAPAGATSLDLAIFDGDTGTSWDQGSGVMSYALFEDGDADGESDPGESQVSQWLGSAMADNAWSSLTAGGTIGGAPINPAAYPNSLTPSGNRFFRLIIQLTNTTDGTLSCFKVRTTASIRIESENSFSFIASLSANSDLTVVYPNYPSLVPTRYDGTWDVYAYVPSSVDYREPTKPHAFDVWDGDFDFGHFDAAAHPSEQDTDDPNTPNPVASLPAWAQASNPSPEGRAAGFEESSGNPPDDFSRDLFRRAPSVTYDVTDPTGVRYANRNPSGNTEWELFRIETDPALKNNVTAADAAAPGAFLPPGVFQIHIDGMDLTNLNSLRFDYDILGVDSLGNPVKPLLPYLIGDTVFSDLDRDGVRDAGEPGIANVAVTLLDDADNVIDSAVTNSSGQYLFDVDAGEYTVRVEVENLSPTGPLAGLHTTTGGELHTETVTTFNRLTYDFGYATAASGSVGDLVWLDVDADGMQDAGEPGLRGVTVTLSEGGSPLATTTTDLNGFYLFGSVDATISHTYTIAVSGTILAGFTQTFDSDGLASARQSTVVLPAQTSNLAQDFGFRGSASVGDQVWNDLSQPDNEVFNAGTDLGLANVRMVLTWDFQGDGLTDLRYVTSTDAQGRYRFDGLPPAAAPGLYRVRVDTNTLPFGMTLIADPDGTTTPSSATLTLAAGVANLSQDFGYRGAGSIGDRVWYDLNANGVQDADESGLPGVTLTLHGDFNRDGSIDYTASTGTDAAGAYVFTHLPAGQYTVTADRGAARSSWNATYDLDGNGTPNLATATLAPRGANVDFDFGYSDPTTVPGSVGDLVWNDADGDGIKDSGEPGLAGVTVKLFTLGNALVATQVTDANGGYRFIPVAPGSYYVQFTAPAGYVFAPMLQGGNPSTDSDADGANGGKSASFTLTPRQNLLTLDAGLYQPASVGDFVWNDVNRDGLQNAGEGGIAGVTVRLFTPANVQVGASVTTAADGAYAFSGLVPGSYYVQFTLPATYVFSPRLVGTDATKDSDADLATGKTAVFTAAAGQTVTTQDAGGYQVHSVGDRVWVDTDGDGIQDGGENGLSGASVRLYSSTDVLLATTTSNGSGIYGFSNLAAGSYYLQFTLPNGYAFTTRDRSTGGGNDTNDSDADPATGRTAAFTLSGGQALTAMDAGAVVSTTATVGDLIWDDQDADGIQDPGEAGLAGASVRLFTAANAAVGSPVTTTASGLYNFSGLATGSYYITVTLPSGFVFSPKDVASGGSTEATDSDVATATGKSAPFTLATGENRTTVDAGGYRPASAGDFAWVDTNADGIQDADEPGLAGVTVKLFSSTNSLVATQTTDSAGHYLFTGLAPASYSLEFTAPASYRFSPRNAGDPTTDSDADPATGKSPLFTLTSGAAPSTYDAGLYQTAGVGDFVWNDQDRDGVQDAGEPGLAGVLVKLFGSTGLQVGAAVTTPGSGAYAFTGLTPGSYTLHFVAPGRHLLTLRDQGGNDALDSDPDASTGITTPFVLASGQMNTTLDAGAAAIPPASVGDFVWLDADRDGVQDPGETGLAGVTVRVFDAATDGQVGATVTTAGDGAYSFTGLDPGSYYVTFGLPAGYLFSSRNAAAGTTATDSDADLGTGRTATFTLSAGQNRTDVDAGANLPAPTGSIGDFVWSDLDADGVQDPGEPGLAGVTVKLFKTAGSLLVGSPVVTGANGAYSFSDLVAGSYYLEFTLPGGALALTTADTGGDDALDSDADPLTGRTVTLALSEGQTLGTVDCGVLTLGSIGGTVWLDANRDGVRQGGETGIAGVTVTLAKGGGPTVTTTSAADGVFLFTSARAGSYTLSIAAGTIPTAVIPTAALVRTADPDGLGTPDLAALNLSSGEDRRLLDFGYGRLPIPAAPTSLTATLTGGHVPLTWQHDGINVTIFVLERKAGTGNFATLVPLGPTTRSYTDTTVVGGNQYTYRIYASGPGGDSAPSNAPSVTLPPPIPGKLKVGKKVNFGTVKIGGSKQVRVKVTNAGKGGLSGTATVLTGPFELVGSGTFSLLPKQSATLTVRFAPTAAGAVSGSLQLRTDDPARSLVTLPITAKSK